MKFTISFDKSDIKKVHGYWDEIFTSQTWSEGKFTTLFEDAWGAYSKTRAVAFSSWSGAALAALEYYNVKDRVVLCPSNTFMATPLSVVKAGGVPEFVDCNKTDLCMSYDDLVKKIEIYNPKIVMLVHIGGHIAFDVERITAVCKERGIILIEDCAHAHGASWKGKKAGTWGSAGIYSFYATKTMSTGEGGMLVTHDESLCAYARKYRNYGKFEYDVPGLNFRMSEFTAALGCVQTDRLNDIIAWKNEYAEKVLNPVHPKRVYFPDGMVSGYYKYIVFEEVQPSTGKVYDSGCHTIMKRDYSLPNTDWVNKNHWCVPIYYKGDE
jgi:dTDP-4-amino-4,6-dideoxygalactose transaminase